MSDSEVSEIDFRSEDGEIKLKKIPLGKDKLRQELPFSLSDDDAEDTTDSLDIKPPQANVHSLKSRSHSGKHSHREKERHANGHSIQSRSEDRIFKKGHHRSREERHRDYKEERHRERAKRHHREKHGDVIEAKRERLDYGVDELRHREEAYRSHRGETSRTSYRDVLEGRREDPRDVHTIRELRDARDPQDMRELREARDAREFRQFRDREREKGERQEGRGKDRVHKEKVISDQNLDDLRERIVVRRREGESHRHHERERLKRERREVQHQLQQLERRHQQLEEEHQQQALMEQVLPPAVKETPQERAEREERESRRLKLLEAEKEMIRQKEVYRRELEARRARRQVEEEKEGTLGNIAMKSDSFDSMQVPNEESVVLLSDASETEMQDDKEEALNSSERSKKRAVFESESAESDATSNSLSDDDDSDETESDGRASDAEDNEVVRNINGTEDGHIDKSHSDTDFAPVENGNVSSPPLAEADGLNDLPPYLPAIQGCRSIKEYDYLNRIEEGTYGIVYRACEKRTGEIVALKRLKMEREKEGFPITSLREINTLLKAQHKNIVTVREIVLDSSMDKIFIVMDYVAHDMKSLMETMKHKKQVFLTGEVKCLMQQLLSAVHHMHDNWILHRDLKTSNLLLSHDGILKVGDFGLAREYGSPLKNYTEIVVTLWYRSPELLLGTKEYSTHIDLWSVGCIFAEFLLMGALFPGKSEMDQIKRIFKELGTPNEDIWPGYNQLPHVQKINFANHPINNLRKRFHSMLTEQGLDLLNKFLTYNPVQRITADEALDHPYFKEVPVAIDPSMFPTWPAKSEGFHRKAASPKAPSGGKEYKELGDGDDDVSAMGFHMGTIEMERTRLAVGAGFSLRF